MCCEKLGSRYETLALSRCNYLCLRCMVIYSTDTSNNHWITCLTTTSVTCAVGPSVITSSTETFLPKPGFQEFIWIFNCRNHLKINISHILNPNLTKYIPLNPAHQDLSNNTKGTFQFPPKFQLRFNLIFTEEIIQYSRTFALQVQTPWTMPMHPSSSRAFLRHQEHDLSTIWSIPVWWIS
jgi:hypothetical protein